MKRVLIFSLNYYPFVGGAEVALKEITDRIRRTDIEFHMIVSHNDSTLARVEQMGNVLVHRIGLARPNPSMSDLKKRPLNFNKHLYQLLAAWKALELHRKYHYDGIWAMIAHACAIPAGIFKTLHPEVKYLLTLQEGDPPEYIERLMRPVWPLFKQGFTRADVLQPISHFLRAWGIRMGFTGESAVIPNAVDSARFSHAFSFDERAHMKETLGKKEGDIFLVTTSRLVHKNAIDDVIRALALLPAHISFLIYGVGPDEAALKTLAKERGVESRVRFMGQIDQKDIPLMLTACDIFIRPSRSEGMGISFLEAMAARLPVIATQEGGIPDFLFDAVRNPDHDTTGWAVDRDSPGQIARAVQDICARPDVVEKVTATAHALVVREYDWKLIAAKMQRLFDDMLASR